MENSVNRTAAPIVSLPIPLRTSPHCATAERHTRAWARGFGLVRSPAAAARFDAAGFGTFAGYIHPDAPPERLALYADWIAWQFLADDQYAEGNYRTPESWTSAIAQLWPVFATGHANPDDSPIARALSDVLSRVYPQMSASWRARFITHTRETFHAVVAENLRRHTRVFATIEEYIHNRRAVSSVLPCLAIDEFMADGEVPDNVLQNQSYQQLVQTTTDVAAWANDLYSWQKEEAAGEVDNFVLVLEHAEHLTRREAINAVANRISHRADQFITAQDALTSQLDTIAPDPATRRVIGRCLASMRNWMAGTLAWSAESARYTVIDPTAAQQVPGYIDDLLRAQLAN